MENDKNVTVKLQGVRAKGDAGKLALRQKSNFAVQHLMAAARFSRMCGAIQQENLGKPLGPFYDEQISYVSATVMLCVASLESNVNEYLSDPDKLFPELSDAARQEFTELVSELSILEKYQRILSIKGLNKFNEGAKPYQDVDVLIAVRNELVHFHPEWHDEQQRHKKLGQRMMYRFELSPFISEGAGVLFPQRFISHGCTKWAVESSLSFMGEFAGYIGHENKFTKFNERLST
jgi:hypothetical protein